MTVSVDLTARTFQQIREHGLNLLRERIGQFAYNDAAATGVAPAIIDVLAWFHEQNAHYYDRRRRNSLLFLADTLESMRLLTRAQGFRMRPATAASVALTAQPTPPQPAVITLPAGTRLVVDDLIFELVNAAAIPSSATTWPDGTTDDLITVTEGVTRTDRFVSDGSPHQSFTLSQPGTIEGSVSVSVLGEVWEEVPSLVFVEGTQAGRDQFVGDGTDDQEFTLSLLHVLTAIGDDDGISLLVFPFGQPQENVQVWQQVEDFAGAPREFVVFQDIDGETRVRFGSAADDAAPGFSDSIQVLYLISGAQKRYQLVYDEFDTGRIGFGDSTIGVIPTDGADVVVSYRVGGGVRGNVPPGTIDITVQGVLPSGAFTPVRLRNLERGSGGEPPQTLEEARFYAPRFAKSNDRAVTKSDWNTLANTYIDPVFGAPSHASAFLKQRRPELNTVCVAVWGRDELGRISTPGTPLKVGIKRFLDTRRTFTTAVEMKDGKIILMDVSVSILLDQGATRQVVFQNVTTAIQAFFDSAFVRPGVDLPIGGLFQAIENVAGVDRSNIDSIVGSQLAQLQLGIGDGTTKSFSGDFVLASGTSVVQESITVTDGTQQVVDNGSGAFTGDVDISVPPGAGNFATYTSGKFSMTFASPPAVDAVIQAEAKLEVFFAAVDVIGSSDGSFNFLDTASTYYPIVKRTPRAIWSGDQVTIVDGAQVGGTAQFRGTIPTGIIPNSPPIPRPLRFIDSSSPPQIAVDNGLGVLTQSGPAVGSVSYTTGLFNFTFAAAPVLPVRAEWSTRTVDVFIPDEFLPLTPGRLFIWGGYSAFGVQAGGAELLAFDDGDGNMVGDVLTGGVVVYETGRVTFTWNTDPPPGIAGGALRVGRLVQAPDGVLTTFDFEVRDESGGGGSTQDVSSTGLGGEGRTLLRLTDLSTPGFALADAYDNHKGALDGTALDLENDNFITYSVGTGRISFGQPLPAGVPATGSITTPVAASLVDGETFTLDDGINTPVVFEFDTVPDGVGGGNEVVDISGATTADEVRDIMVIAINGATVPLAMTASPGAGAGELLLTNTVTGPQGNEAITETVVDAGFVVSGMAGGSGTVQEFGVQITNVGNYMVSAFVFRVKTPTGPGLDKGLFADSDGRLWGDTANAFPTDRLDHLRGRIVAALAGAPVPLGRSLELTYDALTGVPPVRDVPVAGDEIAVAGRISLTETPPEVDASA
jgi:hypothetical protein